MTISFFCGRRKQMWRRAAACPSYVEPQVRRRLRNTADSTNRRLYGDSAGSTGNLKFGSAKQHHELPRARLHECADRFTV